MYTLERLQPEKAQGLPLYPCRVVPDNSTPNDYKHIKLWCAERMIKVHIPEQSYYIYFESEQNASFFILGYKHGD